jgi:hypothetical protein
VFALALAHRLPLFLAQLPLAVAQVASGLGVRFGGAPQLFAERLHLGFDAPTLLGRRSDLAESALDLLGIRGRLRRELLCHFLDLGFDALDRRLDLPLVDLDLDLDFDLDLDGRRLDGPNGSVGRKLERGRWRVRLG